MYQVLSQWLDHEGGTKFYQVFRIYHCNDSSGDERLLTVTHWGPNRGLSGATCRPVECGQIQLLAGYEYKTKLSAKKRGGYLAKRSEGSIKVRDSEFKDWVVLNFGGAHEHEIVSYFAPITIGETRSIEETTKGKEPEPIERPATWGSW